MESDGDWRPTASLERLRQRAKLLSAVRRFFDERGYWEVETPLLSHDVCVDTWLDPLCVTRPDPTRVRPMFLQTSPEFGMKRLLAAGADAIYQVTRSFRRGEMGRLHNPEFTIVEWYRVQSNIAAQMDLVEELVRTVQAVAERTPNLPGDAVAGEGAAGTPARFERLSYDEAFERFAGQRVLSATPDELAALAQRHNVPVPAGFPVDDRDVWLNLLLASVVEPRLAELGGVFIYDYPASQAALARLRCDQPPVAERFELYLHGIELCNGYQELTEAAELATRMRHHAERRRSGGLDELPTNSRLLEAMRHGLPECAGVALGFDRLAMWALRATAITDVLTFPWPRA